MQLNLVKLIEMINPFHFLELRNGKECLLSVHEKGLNMQICLAQVLMLRGNQV